MARVCGGGGGYLGRCSSDKTEASDRARLEIQEYHVLAVDDSFVDRKVIERLLKISSCKVTVVESGKRALQFLGLDEEESPIGSKRLKVHLIITDYSMPGMTGYELLKKIKESSAFREVPVVIMSSENFLSRIERCLKEGAKEYLVKPVKLSDVKRLIEFITVSGDSNFKTNTEECEDGSSLRSFHPLASSSREIIINPLFQGYPCSSPKCFCISRRPRFRSRSSKYHHSESSFY